MPPAQHRSPIGSCYLVRIDMVRSTYLPKSVIAAAHVRFYLLRQWLMRHDPQHSDNTGAPTDSAVDSPLPYSPYGPKGAGCQRGWLRE